MEEQPPSWKEVAKDGKPPKSGQYHVYYGGTSLMSVKTYDPARGADFDEFVTHWRELPEPPQLPPKPPQPPRELYVAEYPENNLAGVWWRDREEAEKAQRNISCPYRLIRFREVIE